MAQRKSKKLKEFYKNNPEYKKAASEKAKLQFSNPANHYASKKIINIETGETFSCAKELAKHLNKPAGTVRNWLRGDSKNKTSYRYA
jgi:hypothetical protein